MLGKHRNQFLAVLGLTMLLQTTYYYARTIGPEHAHKRWECLADVSNNEYRF